MKRVIMGMWVLIKNGFFRSLGSFSSLIIKSKEMRKDKG